MSGQQRDNMLDRLSNIFNLIGMPLLVGLGIWVHLSIDNAVQQMKIQSDATYEHKDDYQRDQERMQEADKAQWQEIEALREGRMVGATVHNTDGTKQ